MSELEKCPKCHGTGECPECEGAGCDDEDFDEGDGVCIACRGHGKVRRSKSAPKKPGRP